MCNVESLAEQRPRRRDHRVPGIRPLDLYTGGKAANAIRGDPGVGIMDLADAVDGFECSADRGGIWDGAWVGHGFADEWADGAGKARRHALYRHAPPSDTRADPTMP